MDVYHHLAELQPILDRLDELKALLTQQRKAEMADLEALRAEVAKVSTVEDSALALIKGLRDQLAAAQAGSDPAAIQAIIDQLDAKATELAAAVAGPA